MNTGNFAGYIGRDADLKTVGDSAVANFSIAVSTYKSGEKGTLWVSCALWGERASKLAQYLTKGSAVSVSGDVDIRTYNAKDGSAKAELTCNVQRVTLQGGGERKEAVAAAPSKAAPLKAAPTIDDDFNDPVPFN